MKALCKQTMGFILMILLACGVTSIKAQDSADDEFSFPVAFKANLIADITQIAHAVTFFVSYEESYLHGFKSQAKRLFAEDGLGSLIPVIHAEGEFRTAEVKPFLIDI